MVLVVVASLVRWGLGFFGETLLPFPIHHGFGLRLLSRALEQFDGAAETAFEPDGFICTMKALLPEGTLSIVPTAIQKPNLGENRKVTVTCVDAAGNSS